MLKIAVCDDDEKIICWKIILTIPAGYSI